MQKKKYSQAEIMIALDKLYKQKQPQEWLPVGIESGWSLIVAVQVASKVSTTSFIIDKAIAVARRYEAELVSDSKVLKEYANCCWRNEEDQSGYSDELITEEFDAKADILVCLPLSKFEVFCLISTIQVALYKSYFAGTDLAMKARNIAMKLQSAFSPRTIYYKVLLSQWEDLNLGGSLNLGDR